MCDDDSYNGWGNFETWLVNIWLTTDEGIYTELIEAADSEADFASNLRAFVREKFGPQEESGLLEDVWRAFLDHIRWKEIAEEFRCFARDRRARASTDSSHSVALSFPGQSEREASQNGRKAPSFPQDAQPAGSDLKRGFSEEIPMEHRDDAPKDGDIIGGLEVISSYSTKQAVEDGVLIPVGNVWGAPVYMTSNLFSRGYEDEQRRSDLINRGLNLLAKDDQEDTPYMKLRVIEKDKAWVIYEPGQQASRDKYTYLAPEDY